MVFHPIPRLLFDPLAIGNCRKRAKDPKAPSVPSFRLRRAALRERLETMPLRVLVQIQEVAALLEAGERLEVLLARDRVGKKGASQVQPRENADRGMRTEAFCSAENRELEEEERAAIVAAVAGRRLRFSA
jgi:hypothetical protein